MKNFRIWHSASIIDVFVENIVSKLCKLKQVLQARKMIIIQQVLESWNIISEYVWQLSKSWILVLAKSLENFEKISTRQTCLKNWKTSVFINLFWYERVLRLSNTHTKQIWDKFIKKTNYCTFNKANASFKKHNIKISNVYKSNNFRLFR